MVPASPCGKISGRSTYRQRSGRDKSNENANPPRLFCSRCNVILNGLGLCDDFIHARLCLALR